MGLSAGRITPAMAESAAQMGIPVNEYYSNQVLGQAQAKQKMSWLSPSQYKVNQCQATTDDSWVAWILWSRITPGSTAIFLLLSALWFYLKARASTDTNAKGAYNDAAWVLVFFGGFNLLAQFAIVFRQRYQALG